MAKTFDLSGQRFGRLVAICKEETPIGPKWKCLCDCGNTKYASTSDLRGGKIKSCNCLQRETQIATTTKHGACGTKLYNSYHNMKKRCLNSNSAKYASYGGRGIKICDEWLGKDGFIHFMDWANNNGYKDGLTIERINVNGNYEPDNCTWIPLVDQAINRRSTHWITYSGITLCLKHWADKIGIKRDELKALAKKIGDTQAIEYYIKGGTENGNKERTCN